MFLEETLAMPDEELIFILKATRYLIGWQIISISAYPFFEDLAIIKRRFTLNGKLYWVITSHSTKRKKY